MANYSAIKAATNAYIKTNGRQEITGDILNAVILAVIGSLGRFYQFGGLATPSTNPGNPDENVAYLASTEGIYSNMGGIQIAAGEIAIIKFGGEWVKQTICTIPTKLSEITNDVGFVTNAVGDLLNYYLKSETYSRGQVNAMIAAVHQFEFVVADELPDASADTMYKIYLIPSSMPGDDDVKDEFVTIEDNGTYSWEQIGRTSVDLSDYPTNEEMALAIDAALAAYVSSISASVDNNVGTPSVDVSYSEGELSLSFHNLKGAQGDPGSSVDYPFTLANNLETNDTTKALTAAMGKVLGDKVETLMNAYNNLAPWAFKTTPNYANPIYKDVVFFPVYGSPGVGLVRYGYTSSLVEYMMSPVYDLGEIGESFNITFSTGDITTSGSASYPGILYLDENMLPYTYHLANANPRSVTGTVSSNQKYIRLIFVFSNIMSAYIKDNVTGQVIFEGNSVNLADIQPKESILTSDYWKNFGPNSREDWIGWNFASTNVAATAFRNNINYPIFKNVGQNASAFSYSVSKVVALPTGDSSLSIEFSCGVVNSDLALRLLNPATGVASYYAANANPRTVTIDTTTYTHLQLYFLTVNYEDCYIKDATNDVMLWQGANSID